MESKPLVYFSNYRLLSSTYKESDFIVDFQRINTNHLVTLMISVIG